MISWVLYDCNSSGIVAEMQDTDSFIMYGRPWRTLIKRYLIYLPRKQAPLGPVWGLCGHTHKSPTVYSPLCEAKPYRVPVDFPFGDPKGQNSYVGQCRLTHLWPQMKKTAVDSVMAHSGDRMGYVLVCPAHTVPQFTHTCSQNSSIAPDLLSQALKISVQSIQKCQPNVKFGENPGLL